MGMIELSNLEKGRRRAGEPQVARDGSARIQALADPGARGDGDRVADHGHLAVISPQRVNLASHSAVATDARPPPERPIRPDKPTKW